jgi:transcriptional regulator with XRE-family HTH domain
MSRQQKSSEKENLFAERLRLRLGRLNLQANELAAQLDLAPSAVSNWLAGANCAKGSNLRRLAAVLSCDPAWLLGREAAAGAETAPAPAGEAADSKALAEWRRRALAAEQRVRGLEDGLRSLLDPAGPAASRAPRSGVPSVPSIPPPAAVSSKAASATGRAAKRLLRVRPRDPAAS